MTSVKENIEIFGAKNIAVVQKGLNEFMRDVDKLYKKEIINDVMYDALKNMVRTARFAELIPVLRFSITGKKEKRTERDMDELAQWDELIRARVLSIPKHWRFEMNPFTEFKIRKSKP